ncbi:MAG: CoA-binding protein [Ignavibacteria bacterium]
MEKTDKTKAKQFLRLKRIAFIGVSGKAKDFSRMLFNELINRSYEVIPVNPLSAEIEGRTCFKSIGDIIPAADAVIIFTKARPIAELVSQCINAGVTNIWVQNGQPNINRDTSFRELCENNGVSLITGCCPYMFLPGASFIHRLHGFFAGVKAE